MRYSVTIKRLNSEILRFGFRYLHTALAYVADLVDDRDITAITIGRVP